jgi:hypothetical protein
MNAIRSVFNAFANLANAVNGLANVLNEAGNRLRMQLDYEPPAVPALPKGQVIDAEPDTTPTGNGRSRKAKANA